MIPGDSIALLPPALIYGLAGLVGLTLGSFYTALASRILYYFYGPGRKAARRMGFARRWWLICTRSSHCMACGTNITGVALTPILGYALSGGRCRRCGTTIGPLTLLGEVLPGVLLPLLLCAGYPPGPALLYTLLAGQLYIALVTDWNFFLLDHENALWLLAWAVPAVWLLAAGDQGLLMQHAWTAFVALLVFLALFLGSRMRGFGFGDVVLGGILAFTAGHPWALLLFQLAAAGALAYIFLIQRDRHAPAPLGAFFVLAFYVTLIATALWRIYSDGARVS